MFLCMHIAYTCIVDINTWNKKKPLGNKALLKYEIYRIEIRLRSFETHNMFYVYNIFCTDQFKFINHFLCPKIIIIRNADAVEHCIQSRRYTIITVLSLREARELPHD